MKIKRPERVWVVVQSEAATRERAKRLLIDLADSYAKNPDYTTDVSLETGVVRNGYPKGTQVCMAYARYIKKHSLEKV